MSAKKPKKYSADALVPTSTLNKTVGTGLKAVDGVSGAALGGANTAVKGVTDTLGDTAQGLPVVGGTVKQATDGLGKTTTAATGGLQNTLGNTTQGLNKTVGQTTDALGRGDALGAVGGVTSGAGQTVSGLGKGLVRQDSKLSRIQKWLLEIRS